MKFIIPGLEYIPVSIISRVSAAFEINNSQGKYSRKYNIFAEYKLFCVRVHLRTVKARASSHLCAYCQHHFCIHDSFIFQSIPTQFVDAMLEVHSKYTTLIKEVFNADQQFIGALDKVRPKIVFMILIVNLSEVSELTHKR